MQIDFKKLYEERKKRSVALYMLIKHVDDNNGNVEIGTDSIKRAFNDENDIVKVEKADGSIELAADQDFETLDAAVRKLIA